MTNNSTNKVDLHMHSSWSLDGDFDVASLFHQCKDAGLSHISLADHNSIRGVTQMQKLGNQYDIKVTPAIEIDCEYKNTNLHILGYNINTNDERFNALGDNLLTQEREASPLRVKLVEDLGIFINHEILDAITIDGIVTGEMIAEASLYEIENEGNLLLTPFLEGGHLSDNPFVNFYWEFCSQNKPAYVAIKLPTLESIVELIHQSGGIAVFAHPGHNIHENSLILDEIMACGLDGIEAYSSYHSREQINFYVKYANNHNRLISCGSDFHGKIKPNIQLGKLDYPIKYYKAFLEALSI